jgi:hypothetical protein
MSVIAGMVNDEHIVLASDSILVRGWTQEKPKVGKLWQENGVCVASCGLARDEAMLRIFCKRNHPPEATEYGIVEFFGDFVEWAKKRDSGFSLDSSMLVAFGGKLFRMENFFVCEVETFAADGAGMDFALAALHLGKSPREAVEVACELSVYCELPVHEIVLRRAKPEDI